MSIQLVRNKASQDYNDHSPLPETVTLYHSSPVANIDSILKNGLTLTKFDIAKPLEAIDQTKAPDYRKKMARSRLLEPFKETPSGTVCLSGDKEYSIQNGSACKEWSGMLNDKDYHGRVAVFKVVLPIRILEVLTTDHWRSILDRFEELWKKGYFKRLAWFTRSKGWDIDTGINRYDFWSVTHVPPEYIDSYEIVEQSSFGWRNKK